MSTPTIAFICAIALMMTVQGGFDNLKLDLMFLLDSSGSAYDAEYANWQNMLDFCKAVVNSSLPSDSRVGLINFSGCNSASSFDSCKPQGKMLKMWGLQTFGMPNNLVSVHTRISQIDSDDFTRGYTWTNEALTMAYAELAANSTADRSKMIILLSDGAPTATREACINDTAAQTVFSSETLTNLNSLGVHMFVIAIAVSDIDVSMYFNCLVPNAATHLDRVSNFSGLSVMPQSVTEFVMFQIAGVTSDPSLAPSSITLYPSSSPSASPIEHGAPSGAPSSSPSLVTVDPSASPSKTPSEIPSEAPSKIPSGAPSGAPSGSPIKTTTDMPSLLPSASPLEVLTLIPSRSPSGAPIETPSQYPSVLLTRAPLQSPSQVPSLLPSTTQIDAPTNMPSRLRSTELLTSTGNGVSSTVTWSTSSMWESADVSSGSEEYMASTSGIDNEVGSTDGASLNATTTVAVVFDSDDSALPVMKGIGLCCFIVMNAFMQHV